MRQTWKALRIPITISVLSFFISAYAILSTYSSAPSKLATSCDVYGRPTIGYKTELLSWLIVPSLVVSAAVTGVLNVVALAGVKIGRLRDKVMGQGHKVLYPLPVAATLLSLFIGWINITTLLAASSLTPLYPLLIAIWFMAAFVSISFFLAVYILWIRDAIKL